MKVKELIEQLKQIDPGLEVLCYSEDSNLLSPKHIFRLLDIVAVSTTDGEAARGNDQIPSLKLGKSSLSQKYAVIEVTSDF